MNPEEILKKTASIKEQLSTFSDKNVADFVNIEDLLPRYTLMKRISKCQSDLRTQKNNEVMLKIGKLEEDLSKLNGVLESSSNVAKSLKYIVGSSRLLVHLLNYSTRNGSIPMPRQHRELFLQIIANSNHIVSDNITWNVSSINWPEISSVLKSTADTYRHIVEILDCSIGEHHLLHYNTMKMLELMAKLDFH